MNRVDRTSLSEHLAFECSRSLRDCCERIRDALNLPEFSFDSENTTEWGLAEIDNIEYNVSRPYEAGTLQGWDDSVPEGCNFAICVSVYCEHAHAGDHEWAFESLVNPAGEVLSAKLQTSIFYHRTWFGAGENATRDLIFESLKGRSSQR